MQIQNTNFMLHVMLTLKESNRAKKKLFPSVIYTSLSLKELLQGTHNFNSKLRYA